MDMKKKIAIAAAAVFAVLAVVMIAIINWDASFNKINVDLYFTNGPGTEIVSEPRRIRYRDDKELVDNVVEKLRKGPSSSKNGRIMPKDTKLQSFGFVDNGGLIIDFSSSFLSGDAQKNVLRTYAVIKTLCSTGIVTRVKVTVNGECITDRDGKPLDFVAASDINLGNEEYYSEMRKINLYFARGSKLVKEERTIKITDLQPIEQYIINELIKGPKDKSLSPVLSKDTVLMSVDVQDNICYLNFRGSFLKENRGDHTQEKLAVCSIVNSLTELQTISRVQFYMDGKRVEKFGSISIKSYISRDTSIIGE